MLKAETVHINPYGFREYDARWIYPKDINYYMTCPISRSSETMAKCTISANNKGIKS